ncbi:hypothetical protein Gotur_029593 [Gossypium turneri]
MSRKRTRSSKTTPENPILIDKEVKERFDSIFKPEKGFDLKSNDLMVVPIPIRKKINALKSSFERNRYLLLLSPSMICLIYLMLKKMSTTL